MNLRRTKQGLWLLAAVFSVAGAASIPVAVFWPYDDQPQPSPAMQEPARLKGSNPQDAGPQLQQFARLWSKNLRPTLYDPPATTVSATETRDVQRVIRPNIRLIGYAVERDRSLAILAGPDGEVEFKAVGEQLLGVTVRSITHSGVLMDHDGDEYLLKFDEINKQPNTANKPQHVDRSEYGPGRYR